jgi:N-methylhydantoinase A
MRYRGQGHEIPVALPVEDYGEAHREIFRQAFEAAYRKLYGRTIEGVEIEALSWTLTISEQLAAADAWGSEPRSRPKAESISVATQFLYDPASGQATEAPVHLRADLSPGTALDGPCLITEDQTTTVVTAGWRAQIDERGAIVLSRREEQP